MCIKIEPGVPTDARSQEIILVKGTEGPNDAVGGPDRSRRLKTIVAHVQAMLGNWFTPICILDGPRDENPALRDLANELYPSAINQPILKDHIVPRIMSGPKPGRLVKLLKEANLSDPMVVILADDQTLRALLARADNHQHIPAGPMITVGSAFRLVLSPRKFLRGATLTLKEVVPA